MIILRKLLVSEFPRYYIEEHVTVFVNDFGQYVINETNQIEVAGTIEFGNGGMLIIKEEC
jgi:hypothetical protein